MISEINNELISSNASDVPDEGVKTEACASGDEVNNASPMPQASTPADETGDDLTSLSLNDAQKMTEELEAMVKEWEAKNARAEEEARKEREKNENLEATMECGVCLAVLKNPQLLQCGHSVCNVCLRSWWTQPLYVLSGDPIVETDDEDDDDNLTTPVRRRFHSSEYAQKLCPICKKLITHRPVRNVMVNDMVKTLNSFLPVDPIPGRSTQVQRGEHRAPKDLWRGIFPKVKENVEQPTPEPTSETAVHSREEVRELKLQLWEYLARHQRELERTVARINNWERAISQMTADGILNALEDV